MLKLKYTYIGNKYKIYQLFKNLRSDLKFLFSGLSLKLSNIDFKK